jgi:hypothetical protein
MQKFMKGAANLGLSWPAVCSSCHYRECSTDHERNSMPPATDLVHMQPAFHKSCLYKKQIKDETSTVSSAPNMGIRQPGSGDSYG